MPLGLFIAKLRNTMIKLIDFKYSKAVMFAQNQSYANSNYLIDILSPTLKQGDWDKLEKMEIGYNTQGKSLGKIDDDQAWKHLHSFFEPNKIGLKTLDFTFNSKVIERNFRNEIKALILKMLWLSPKEYSFETIYITLITLKKFIKPLLAEGLNSFSFINFERLEKWANDRTIKINFQRQVTYSVINRLIIEQEGLPFCVALNKVQNENDFNLNLIESEQHPVIPQRLYFQALFEAESLIRRLYSIRDEIEALSTYLATFKENVYKGYAKYLHQGVRKHSNGDIIWLMTNKNKYDINKNQAFKEEFNVLTSPTEAQILALVQMYSPVIHPSAYPKFYPGLKVSISGMTVSTPSQATTLLMEYCGGCLWVLLAKSGMRVDEIYHLQTVNGWKSEIVSNQVIYVLNADLSKTTKGKQAVQDEFVTTKLGMKAYEILQAIHTPLRKCHPESNRFFHSLTGSFDAVMKAPLSKQAVKWFNRTLASETNLTKEDIKDLKISDPTQSFQLGEGYNFSCHQLRRSFAYYLIGYELLSFPQLKQQFSHLSLAMTRYYAKNASKFQRLRKKNGMKNLCSVIDDERAHQKAQVYLAIYHRFANKERVAGGKGKAFAKRRAELGENNLFTDKTRNDMLTLEYWENVVRNGQRHIHVVAPGIFCTSVNCSLRTQVNLIECVNCDNDYIMDAVYAEAMRKEAEEHMYYDIMHNELTPQTASESYIKITAAERIMNDLGMEYEPVVFPIALQELLIPQIGVTE
jgi:hypothetical protein